MRQACGDSSLLTESFANGRSDGLLGWQDFDGDVAIERELVRQVHRAHSAPTELTLDAVLKSDRSVERASQRIGLPLRPRDLCTAFRAEARGRGQRCTAGRTLRAAVAHRSPPRMIGSPFLLLP